MLKIIQNEKFSLMCKDPSSVVFPNVAGFLTTLETGNYELPESDRSVVLIDSVCTQYELNLFLFLREADLI